MNSLSSTTSFLIYMLLMFKILDINTFLTPKLNVTVSQRLVYHFNLFCFYFVFLTTSSFSSDPPSGIIFIPHNVHPQANTLRFVLSVKVFIWSSLLKDHFTGYLIFSTYHIKIYCMDVFDTTELFKYTFILKLHNYYIQCINIYCLCIFFVTAKSLALSSLGE